MEDYQQRLSIATPEGLRVDLVLAGLGSRVTAALLDLLLKAILVAALLLLASALGTGGIVVASLGVFVVYLAYDIIFETFGGGRTPGKRWTHLRVLRADGRAIDGLSSAIRNTIRLIDGLTLLYVPGMLSILLTARNQRLGDLAGRTIVVRELLVPAEPTRGEQDGWLPAPLRAPDGPTLDVSAVTAQDLAALRAFLQRRDALPIGPRTDIARRLADAVRPRVGGGTETLGPEPLIEAVVDAKG